MRKTNHASRDRNGRTTFYVLLRKRSGISLELFDAYWTDVHGSLCARLPGQHQYWQFHLAHSDGGLWPTVEGIDSITPDEAQIEGIAELTFRSEEDRQTWFKAAAILMDDEHNLFSKAIGYNTAPGNSRTYVDGIEDGEPNGAVGVQKFHVLVQKAEGVSVEEFRWYLTERFARQVAESERVLKLRLHLFEEVDNSRPDAAGVSHREAPEQQYQAAIEMAFSNHLEMEGFFASDAYASAVRGQASYIKRLRVFPERTAYTFVYDDRMTLAGQRSSTVAELIRNIGAVNQLRDDVALLMLKGPAKEERATGGAAMNGVSLRENAVLGDEELQRSLRSIYPRWGDFCIRSAGEVWGLPLINQKTKALIATAVDVVSSNVDAGSPFEAHVDMALKQGATVEEIEELLLFMSVYAGFNKVASALGILEKLRAAS